MRWTSVSFLTAALAMLTLSGFVVAGEKECSKGKAVAAQKNIDGLLTKWEAANENLAKACPDATAKAAAKVAKTAESCPIGSRMGETLGFVQEALASAVAADKACAESCGAKKEKAGCEKLASMAKARSKLLCSLSKLTGRSTVAMSGGCSAKKADCDAKAAVVKGDFCAKSAEKLVATVKGEACNGAAAKHLIKAIDGLECSKKAEKLAASIKKEACAKSAAKLIVAAAKKEECASKKSVAKGDFCAKSAEKLVATVKGEECNGAAAKHLIKAIDGLECSKKAEKLAASIKKEACAKSAAKLIVAAAKKEECASKKNVAKGDFCAKSAEKLVATVKGEECNGAAAKHLIKAIDGLECSKKAEKLAASIKKEACSKSAAKLIVAAAKGEECASKKSVAKGDFCAKSAEKLVATVKGEECNGAAAKHLIKAIDGLECSKKAEKLAASIKKEECSKSAAKLIVAAAKSEECASKKTVAKGDFCGKSAEKGGCAKSLLARACALKTSWDQAAVEYAGLDQATRKAHRAEIESFPEHIKLIPASVLAIQEGVDSLVAMNEIMCAAAKENPELTKGISDELKARFKTNAELMNETREILARMRKVMDAAMADKS